MKTFHAVLISSIIVIAMTIGLRITIANLTLDQRLIAACHRVDLEAVKLALSQGANANARFGQGDRDRIFGDGWYCGFASVTSGNWTPLLAVANSNLYPPPPRRIRHTPEDLLWAKEEKWKISSDTLQKRAQDAVEIVQLLIDHKATLDIDDGYGGTPLYDSLYFKKFEMAKLLIKAGANVNTKTKVCFCGAYEITPLHRATWSIELVQLLLEKGADRNAKDSRGRTPADWAKSYISRRGDERTVERFIPPPPAFIIGIPSISSEDAPVLTSPVFSTLNQ